MTGCAPVASASCGRMRSVMLDLLADMLEASGLAALLRERSRMHALRVEAGPGCVSVNLLPWLLKPVPSSC